MARRKQRTPDTLDRLACDFPEGALVLYYHEGQADIGVVAGHDTDGLGRPYVRLPGRRTAYRFELKDTLTKAQARELYALAMENHGRIPHWVTVAGELDIERDAR